MAMGIEDALRFPIIQFAILHILAAIAIYSGSGTPNGHAILRLSPLTCLHELIEHCTYASHVLQDRFMLRHPSRQNAEERHMALVAAQWCSILTSTAITIYLTSSQWVISWTVLFSWIYTLRSLALLLLPPLTSLQDAISITEAARIKQQVTMTRATIVHLTACVMIAASDQASGLLVVGGGILITVIALGLDQVVQRQSTHGSASLFTLVAGGLLHHLWITAAFLLPSLVKVDDAKVAVAVFDGAWLSVPLSRGSDNIHHAVFFAATTWCVGLIFYGMASS